LHLSLGPLNITEQRKPPGERMKNLEEKKSSLFQKKP
jgi:hypothetical protein